MILMTRGEMEGMPKETILVIEDDRDIVEIIQYNFEREGYRASVPDQPEPARAPADPFP